jgi:hypothetical protein
MKKRKSKRCFSKRKRSARKTKSRRRIYGGSDMLSDIMSPPNFTFNESEGKVYVKPNKGVAKIYNKFMFFLNELEGYKLFNQFDPLFQFHPQLLSEPGEYENKPYILMEYVGVPVDTNLNEYFPLYRQFMVNVLRLQNNEGNYILHKDGHSGNVCILGDQVKYIDLGGLVIINANALVDDKTVDYLKYNLSTFFRARPDLIQFIENEKGKTYSQAIDEITAQLETIHALPYVPSRSTGKKFDPPKTENKSGNKLSSNLKSRKLFEDSDSDDDTDNYLASMLAK